MKLSDISWRALRKGSLFVFATLLVLTIVALLAAGPRIVSIQFDWDQTEGFKSISVEWPPLGPLYSFLITAQAKPWIVWHFQQAGWKSAKGKLNLRVVHLLFVRGFVGEGWEISDPEVTPLMEAARKGDSGEVTRLVAGGSDVNVQDQRGWTALMHIAMKGKGIDAKVLLAAGADPNIRDRKARTAFLYAAWSCRTDVLMELAAAGADLNAKDGYGSSAMGSTGCPKEMERILREARVIQTMRRAQAAR